MTDFNTDYNNTELLDQELTIEELEAMAGGICSSTINFSEFVDPVYEYNPHNYPWV